MNYEIIFYHSGKTAEAERLTDKKLSALSLERSSSCAAMSPAELAKRLKEALGAADIVVIIGGLDGGRQSTDAILSLVLSSKAAAMTCEKLLDDNDNIAYLIKAGRQYILVLPDEPEVIEAMLDKRMIRELCTGYSLSMNKKDASSIDRVTDELKRELSGMPPSNGSYSVRYAEKQKRELRLLRGLTIAALGTAILFLILAVIFVFI